MWPALREVGQAVNGLYIILLILQDIRCYGINNNGNGDGKETLWSWLNNNNKKQQQQQQQQKQLLLS